MTAIVVRQSTCSSFDSLGPSDTDYFINLQYDTLAGNALILLMQANSGDTVSTIVDNQSNANWAQITSLSSGQSAFAWMCTNVAAGTRQIHVTITPSDQFVQFHAMEVSGLSTAAVATALDGAAKTATGITSTTLSTAALANASGSFLVHLASDSGATGGVTVTPGGNWLKQAAQSLSSFYVNVQVAAGTNVTPTMTRSAGTRTYNSLAFAVKADSTKGDATQGNAFIRHMQAHYATPGAGLTTFALEFPCIGNCLAGVLWQGSNTNSVSTVSGSVSGSWATGNPVKTASATNGQIEGWAKTSATTGRNEVITVTYASAIGTAQSGMMYLFDILSAGSVGNSASNTGTDSGTGSPHTVSTVSLAPAAQNSTVLGGVIINSHAVFNLNGGANAKWLATICTFPGGDGGDQDLWDLDGVGVYYNGTDTTSQAWVWNIQNNTNGVGTWAAIAFEIKAPGSAAITPWPFQRGMAIH